MKTIQVQTTTTSAAIRQKLLVRRAELIQRIAGCGLVIEPTPDEMDRIISIELRDQETTKASVLSSDLRSAEAALRRIDNGSFGICEHCENEIPEKRLAAVPWARYCVGCQEIGERQAAADGRSRWGEFEDEELAS